MTRETVGLHTFWLRYDINQDGVMESIKVTIDDAGNVFECEYCERPCVLVISQSKEETK